jgi:hypothetical protein
VPTLITFVRVRQVFQPVNSSSHQDRRAGKRCLRLVVVVVVAADAAATIVDESDVCLAQRQQTK